MRKIYKAQLVINETNQKYSAATKAQQLECGPADERHMPVDRRERRTELIDYVKKTYQDADLASLQQRSQIIEDNIDEQMILELAFELRPADILEPGQLCSLVKQEVQGGWLLSSLRLFLGQL